MSLTTDLFGQPTCFSWKINGYAEFPATYEPTIEFRVGDETYMLRAKRSKGVILHLKCLGYSSKKYEVAYRICLKSQKCGSVFSPISFTEIFNMSAEDFLPMRRTVFNDDYLSIHCTFKHALSSSNLAHGTTEDAVPYYLPDGLSTDFGKMFVEKMNTDVVLSVGRYQIPAHTAVLSARSSVFEAMFRHDMSEKRSRTVSIVDVSSTTMHRLLRFMYMGKIENRAEDIANLPSQELSQLYAAADKYAVLGLKEMCSHIMRTKLSTSNLEEFALLAYKHNDDAFQASIIKFISEEKSVFETEKWQQLMSRVPQLSAQLLKIAVNKIKL